MENKKINKNLIIKIISSIIFIFLFIVLTYLEFAKNKTKGDVANNTSPQFEEDYLNMKNTSIMYSDSSTIEDLKSEYKLTGQDNLYEVTTEADGRKVLNIKTDINYKVAFCGMIKNSKPSFEEIDKYFKENNTNKNGIWINIPDRQKVLNFINNYNGLNGKYEIDKEGFLYIVDNNNFTDTDRKIEKVINGDKQYVVSIKSYCYMVDTVTGEIVKNPYSDLEEYQTYEYFQDLNKFIIFVSENEDGKLTNEEIFYSLLKLME